MQFILGVLQYTVCCPQLIYLHLEIKPKCRLMTHTRTLAATWIELFKCYFNSITTSKLRIWLIAYSTYIHLESYTPTVSLCVELSFCRKQPNDQLSNMIFARTTINGNVAGTHSLTHTQNSVPQEP